MNCIDRQSSLLNQNVVTTDRIKIAECVMQTVATNIENEICMQCPSKGCCLSFNPNWYLYLKDVRTQMEYMSLHLLIGAPSKKNILTQ